MAAHQHLEIITATGCQKILIAAAHRKQRLTEILRRHQLSLNTRCGQRGLCDGCVLELVAGSLIHAVTGQILKAQTPPLSVRGCEYLPGNETEIQIHIPPRSLLAYEPQVVSDFRVNVPRAHDPLWQQLELAQTDITGSLSPESLTAAITHKTNRRRPVRLAENLKASFDSKIAPLKSASKLFATLEYRDDHWLVTELAAQPHPNPLGVAIDIGTTTVAVLLVNLADGKILSRTTDFNRQMHLGDDVLTRINLCATDPTMLGQFQKAIVTDTITPLIKEVLSKANASPEQLVCLTIAANTTMLHLFAGEDPTPLGFAPFTARFLKHRVLPAASIFHPSSFLFHPSASIHLLPSSAAYVGADLTAGILSSGLIYEDGPSLLVDVGTNGEIILKYKDHLFGCATAAGPAFEGAGLTCGMRAGDGAISDIKFSTNPFQIHTDVIGKKNGAKPAGLCGSAYVDFLSDARRIGLLTTTGRLDKDAVPDAAAHIVPWQVYGLALRIAYGQGKRDIVITEPDIAKLLQAKAAIAAGILTLLAQVKLPASQVKTLHLAGGFGMHIEPSHAIGCGLLPGFKTEQIQIVGNTSLAGAYLALLDCGALDEIARIAKRIEIIELNLAPGFESCYIDQLSLPGQ